MANTFTSDHKEFNNLVKSLSSYGAEVESALNEYVHNEAPQKIKPAIEGLIPVSDRNKVHAKHSAPFGRQEDYNLAVKLITSKEFNYLVFPDEGLGNSKGNAPLDFTGRGLEAEMPVLIDEMSQLLQEKFTTK
jgi:hypothetical protein